LNPAIALARGRAFLGIVERQFLPTADTETAPSVPWFAAITGNRRAILAARSELAREHF
jgi:hypothetical protein